jgi:hypothetical protein
MCPSWNKFFGKCSLCPSFKTSGVSFPGFPNQKTAKFSAALYFSWVNYLLLPSGLIFSDTIPNTL